MSEEPRARTNAGVVGPLSGWDAADNAAEKRSDPHN